MCRVLWVLAAFGAFLLAFTAVFFLIRHHGRLRDGRSRTAQESDVADAVADDAEMAAAAATPQDDDAEEGAPPLRNAKPPTMARRGAPGRRGFARVQRDDH